ncbi:MAG: WD40 repeat domain-containing protein [Oculatellaceae cyanobacterium Prado106]|nr:WD40 repeat domain-containing protein [Oculatellaceae cyanobacterium Prado106]
MNAAPTPHPAPLDVQQSAQGNKNQIIGQAVSSTIFNVTGGQVTIYPANSNRPAPLPTSHSPLPTPYQGLLAFQENDGDRFFGREPEIAILWDKITLLHTEPFRPSILPIYGPSGSGKSSLARAGLIPELARRPLPGRDRARVAILVPGAHPLESLAAVLARVATNDPAPVAKTREFTTELDKANAKGTYDGLRRIVNVLPDTDVSPLIVLVDQFEEVYSLCKDDEERDHFIANLLEAAAEEAQQLQIILTLRSDFLDDVQKHPGLNRIFSEQGFLVPAMDEAELREVIAKPAEQAGHPFDEATVYFLAADTAGREGALPLLQCALSRIWEGLSQGTSLAQILEQIGGVGGALAGSAQQLYDSLGVEEQAIARRIFLGLVQLGEGTRDTRRRVTLNTLISYKDDPQQVKRLIDRFAESEVRLVTCSMNPHGEETAEITHEALLNHWQPLQQWIEASRSDLRFQRRLEDDAQYWEEHQRPEGNLWRSLELNQLRQAIEQGRINITPLQLEFFNAAQAAEQKHEAEQIRKHQRERQHQRQIIVLGCLFTTLVGLFGYQWYQAEVQQIEQFTDTAETLLANQPLNAEVNSLAQINAIAAVRRSQSTFFQLGQNAIAHSTTRMLLHTIQVSEGRKLLDDPVIAIAFSPDGERIVSGDRHHQVRLWNANTHQPMGQPFIGHQRSVLAVAFSPDGQTLASGSVDRMIRFWNAASGQPLGIVSDAHDYSVISVAFSPDGQYLVSSSDDKTIRVWEVRTQKLIRQLQGKDFHATLVGFSFDGQTIFGRSDDSGVQWWDVDTGELLGDAPGDSGRTPAIAFSSQGKTIVSSSFDSQIEGGDRLLKTACTQLQAASDASEPKLQAQFPDAKTQVEREAKWICDRVLR